MKKWILLPAICAMIALYFVGGCGDKPTVKPVVVDTVAVTDEAPAHLRFCAAIANPKGIERAVGNPNEYWPQKKVIRVGFMSNPSTGAPTSAQIEYVKSATGEWDTITNTMITYPATGPYDVRWSFSPNQSWSYIGKVCAQIPQNLPTGNVGWGWNSKNVNGTYTDGCARHEAGHQWAAKHEQCNHNANIPWNKPVVYADMAKQGWDKETVDYNVFLICDPNTHQQTVWDKFSVMQYPIRAGWTTNNTAIPGGQFLSETDKTFWSGVYPKAIQPPSPTTWTVTATQRNNLKRLTNKVKSASDSLSIFTTQLFGQ